ncbi:hypothetical protein Pla110_45790 [Polystyrenella longa]|uniref:Uncharacterized protein n=1 Tax=Polystyrenella longa TaxID=2528007 RepID=A0A518CUC0_9PLAN|nr:hypothetical protein [Polystyrenella longa]QDU82816.1 hypothetical protein Pla110_45790 [Polystyrenella longa]
MRINYRLITCLLTLLLTFNCGVWNVEAQAAGIDARKGFHYHLTEKHGPWMIMVAVFSPPPPERRSKEGLSPQEAANELVYELRSHGLPAYTFEPHEASEKFKVVRNKRDELGPSNQLVHMVGEGSICVLAGNFDIMASEKDNAQAEKTLDKVKEFVPKFLDQETQLEVSAPLSPNGNSNDPRQYGVFQKLKNGAVFASTPGNPKPLSGAFLTINPLRSAEDMNESKRNRYLLDLNSGGEFSLLDNPAKYTLIVATFYGNSKTQALNTGGLFKKNNNSQELGTSLDDSAFKAWEFCKAMRTASNYGYDQNYEAYVLHTRYKSYVTIGSFDNAEDPRIEEMKQLMGAKVRQTSGGSSASMFAEMFSIPKQPAPGQAPQKSWMFDPEPQLSAIPKIK